MNDAFHRGGIHLLSVHCAGRPRNRLIHESPSEIISARLQTDLHAFRTHLDPGRLNVRDQRMQRQPRYCMHEDSFPEGRAPAGAPFQVDRRLHVHKRQRHKFSEATRFVL